MSLSKLAMIVWFFLYFLDACKLVAISATALGITALIVAILLLVTSLQTRTDTIVL